MTIFQHLQTDVAALCLQGKEKLALADLVLEHCADAVMVLDRNDCVVAVNPAFCRLMGCDAPEWLGMRPPLFFTGMHGAAFYQFLWRSIRADGNWQGELSDHRKNGERFTARLSIQTLYDERHAVLARVALLTDITARNAAETLAWRQANFDPLTDLPNRQWLRRQLEQHMHTALREQSVMALLLIDLDEFKEINDALGHDRGDCLLIEVGRRLRECVCDTTAVARLGGDEFAMILSAPEEVADIDKIATRVIATLEGPFKLDAHEAYISASIGIARCPIDGDTPEDLFKHADQALYRAKQSGRNRYSFFTRELHDAAERRMQLLGALRGALAAGQFQLHYQPIVTLATGAVQKAEALLRWHSPQLGTVSPGEFIPLAESSGLIVEIGDWVFQEAARQAKRMRERVHPKFQISVNVSPAQFRSASALNHAWYQRLSELELFDQGIGIEITEGLLLDAGYDVQQKLLGFRDAGVPISLDDFGTGYSSLSYLKKFDLDYLKIDQSFIRDLSGDPDDRALCEAMIVMAHKLGMRVIAEGVETSEQTHVLQSAECDFAQGYHFSEPIPADPFEAWCLASNAGLGGSDHEPETMQDSAPVRRALRPD